MKNMGLKPPKKLYHGTARALGMMIESEGLNPAGPFHDAPEFINKCMNDGKCAISKEGYVYFFEEPRMARSFGCAVAEKVNIGPLAQVFEIDTKNVKAELDPEMESVMSWMHKGEIPADKLRTYEIYDCKKKILKNLL